MKLILKRAGKTLLNFILWVLSLILSVPVMFIGFTINLVISIKNKQLAEFFLILAVGEDQRGGTYMYLTEDWTISSYTYCLGVIKNKKFFYYFMKFIDFLPSICGVKKDHCKHSYKNELNRTIH